LKPFRYCPSCATLLEAGEEEGAMNCGKCGRHWYRNSAPTAGCTFVRDGKALVSRRGSEPEKGRLDIPGGFLQAGEDPIVGLKREIDEELGVTIDVDISDCISMTPHTYGDEGDFVLALGFIATLVDGDPSASDDVAEILWVSLDELDGLDFAWPHDRELVRTALTREEKT
jgi:ADP-ribose pyrophosphatase YjhB (NUDIX family)